MKVSIIIPVYNEEKYVKKCVESLVEQKYPDFEIIVVDDGSTDKTTEILNDFANQKKILLLKQKHLGPGCARNLGASFAKGEILVFVDADMIFDEAFLLNLIKPIIEGKCKGTFSKEEYIANWDKKIAKFWQYNRGIYSKNMVEKKYDLEAPVFRAILKNEFEKVGGYDQDIGYTDDWSLSKKLGYFARNAKGAVYYHFNPETYIEVQDQASWIGKNEFISGNFFRKIKSILKFNLICSIIKGVVIGLKVQDLTYVKFQICYDFAILSSVFKTFFSQNKNK